MLHPWNIVVTTREHRLTQACRLLESFGRVQRTEFFNVITLKVDDVQQCLERVHLLHQMDSSLEHAVARLVPAEVTFLFQSATEFETMAGAAVMPWLDTLAGASFHVRMHRRGFKGRMGSQHEEQFLDHLILQTLAERGAVPAVISFNNPDFILAVETVGQQAGLSLWSRAQLQRYPLVKLD